METNAFRLGYERFADSLLKIKDKKGRIRPFVRNSIQRKVYKISQKQHSIGKQFGIILKYRRGGITTDQQAQNFFTIMDYGKSVVTLAHEKEDTQKIFNIAKLFYQELKDAYRPSKSAKNKREIEFPDLNSEFYIGTAGGKNFGRGSTLARFHGSEVAFWPGSNEAIENLIASLTEATSGGTGILESTANGVNTWFYNQWMEVKEGKEGWFCIFLPWYEDEGNIKYVRDPSSILDTLSDAEEALMKEKGLTVEQISWRRSMKDRLRRLAPQEYPETDEEAFLSTGASYFDPKKINKVIDVSKDAKITKYKDSKTEKPLLRIWERPRQGYTYVAGTDVASGINATGYDFTVTTIICKETKKHVATFKAKMKPSYYCDMVIPILKDYGMPLWGIERNQHGHALLAEAISVHNYPNIYKHEHYDKTTKETRRSPGWPTDSKTRPILLSDLADALELGKLGTNDVELLKQCLGFVMNSNGKFEASRGGHDDDIISIGIAWQMAKVAKGLKPFLMV